MGGAENCSNHFCCVLQYLPIILKDTYCHVQVHSHWEKLTLIDSFGLDIVERIDKQYRRLLTHV